MRHLTLELTLIRDFKGHTKWPYLLAEEGGDGLPLAQAILQDLGTSSPASWERRLSPGNSGCLFSRQWP